MRVDHRRQQAERHAFLIRQAVRQADHARQYARRLDDGDSGAAAEGVLAGQLDYEIQALVEHLRERVRRIKADGREQRPHILFEVLFDPGALRVVAVFVAQQVDALVGQLRQDVLVEQFILARHDLVAFHAGALQRRAQFGRVDMFALDAIGEQAGDAYFEKFIEVAAADAQIAQTLEQGKLLVFRLRQHAPVERQLRQFPVEVNGGRIDFRVSVVFRLFFSGHARFLYPWQFFRSVGRLYDKLMTSLEEPCHKSLCLDATAFPRGNYSFDFDSTPSACPLRHVVKKK